MATLNIMTWNIENLGLGKLKKNQNIGKHIAAIVSFYQIDILFIQETQKGSMNSTIKLSYDEGTIDPILNETITQLNFVEKQVKKEPRKWLYKRSSPLSGFLYLPMSFALSFKFTKENKKRNPQTVLVVSRVIYTKQLDIIINQYNNANQNARTLGIPGHGNVKTRIRQILNVKGVKVYTGTKQETLDTEQRDYQKLWTPERQGIGADTEKFIHKFYDFYAVFPDGVPYNNQIPKSGLTFHCYYQRKAKPETDINKLPPEGYLSKKPSLLNNDKTPSKSQLELDKEHLIYLFQKQSIIRKNSETYAVLYRMYRIQKNPIIKCEDVEIEVGFLNSLNRINNGRPPALMPLIYKNKVIPIIMLHMLFSDGDQNRIRKDLLKVFTDCKHTEYKNKKLQSQLIKDLKQVIILGDLNFAANNPDNHSALNKIRSYGFLQASPLPHTDAKKAYTSLNQLGRYQQKLNNTNNTNNNKPQERKPDLNTLPLSTIEYRSNAYDHIFFKGLALAGGAVVDPIREIFFAIVWKNVLLAAQKAHIQKQNNWKLGPEKFKNLVRATLSEMKIYTPTFLYNPNNVTYTKDNYIRLLANNDKVIFYYRTLAQTLPWKNEYNVIETLRYHNQPIGNLNIIQPSTRKMMCKLMYYYAFEIYRVLISDHLPVIARFTL